MHGENLGDFQTSATEGPVLVITTSGGNGNYGVESFRSAFRILKRESGLRTDKPGRLQSASLSDVKTSQIIDQ